jgi:hypothetical protein
MNYCQLDIAPIVADRTVAVVGHAASMQGTNYGPEIEAHEVVVRCNLRPVPKAEHPDRGQRTDLWFAGNVLRWEEYANVRKTGEYGGAPVCGKKMDFLRKLYQSWNPLEAPDLLRPKPCTWSCTGIVAVFDCLASGAKRVSVYGFDFFRSKCVKMGNDRETSTERQKLSLHNDEERLRTLLRCGYPVRYDKVLMQIMENPE